MKEYTEYWAATMMRGLIALWAASAILIFPGLISEYYFFPFAVVITILCLAAYGTLDSAIVLITSFFIPRGKHGRLASRLQGLVGAMLGLVLFTMVYNHVNLSWFVYLAAFQAAGVAVTELIVAKGTSVHHGARWCYASSIIAGISAVVLLLGSNLSPAAISRLIFGYLGIFGVNLCAVSIRMLFAERKCAHMDRTHAVLVQVIP